MKVIMLDVVPDDFLFAAFAIQWMQSQPPSQKDGIVTFNSSPVWFYIKRNKKSMTVRRITQALRGTR